MLAGIGARVDKDEVALHRTACAVFERPGNYWHMLPEYSQARKAIWNAVDADTGKRRIDAAFPPELRATTNDHEMFIRFKNGSTWQVVGSDTYNSLVGTPPIGLVFSEYSLANPAAWAYLMPILEENGGWSLFIYTPRGRNHGHKLLEMAQSEPAWFAETLTAADTGRFTPEQLARIRREYVDQFGEVYGEAVFEQEYNCSFAAAVLGAFWARQIEQAERGGRICDVPWDPKAPVYTAWDLGVRDATAIWFFQPQVGGINIIDYYQATGVGLDHYADIRKSKPYTYARDYVPHDAKVREWGSGRTRIETMQSMGIEPWLVPQHALMDGINAARQTIAQCRFDAEKCKLGLDALREYHAEWDEERRILRPAPFHNWASHGADAFRYLAMAWRELKGPAPAPPPPKFDFQVNPDGSITSGLTFNEIIARAERKRRDRED